MKLFSAILFLAATSYANHMRKIGLDWRRQGLSPPTMSSEFPTAASPAPSSASTATASASPVVPATTASSAKCGKGYTYCGFMLQSGGHNFAPETVNKTYCDALEDNCVGGIPKTKTDQAVFLCMNDEPATIQLFCACGGKCLNENVTSNIAHCDAPCVNNGKCMNVFQDMDKHMDMGMNMRENMDMHMDLGRKIDK